MSEERFIPLSVSPRFFKAHGLGNDYLVFRQEEGGWSLSPEAVRGICRREEGVGSDGIVVLLDDPEATGSESRPFPLRMFNPDGSEFERSGNGLRVLGAYLLAEGMVGGDPFHVTSGGDRIRMAVVGRAGPGAPILSVEMGRASVEPEAVGLEGGVPELVTPEGEAVAFQPVSVGHPNAVLFPEGDPEEPVGRMGPFLERHPAFRAGTNVQVVRVEEDGGLRIAIWERGVGRTAASGTSSCASAVAAVARGLLPPGEVEVRMAGGTLYVNVSLELDVVLTGPVQEVCTGALLPSFVQGLGGPPTYGPGPGG